MALYIPQSILHLARSLYVRPETYGPTYVYVTMVQKIILNKWDMKVCMDRISLVQYRFQWWASSQLLKNSDLLLCIVLLYIYIYIYIYIFLFASASFRCSG